MIDLRGLRLDVGVEVQLYGVRCFLGLRIALEDELLGLDVELDLVF